MQSRFIMEVDGDEIFIGTVATISTISAQLVVKDAVKPLKMTQTNTWMDLADENGNFALGVGFHMDEGMTVERIRACLDEYEHDVKLNLSNP